MLQEHEIKFAAIHVVGIFAVDAFLLAFVESDFYVRLWLDVILIFETTLKVHFVSALIFGGPGGSELVRELGFFHLTQKIEIAENSHSGGNERLADVGAGKQLALKNYAIHSSLGKIGAHGRACGSPTNNGNVKIRFRKNQCTCSFKDLIDGVARKSVA
jgi:hypothetical protein